MEFVWSCTAVLLVILMWRSYKNFSTILDESESYGDLFVALLTLMIASAQGGVAFVLFVEVAKTVHTSFF